MSNLKMIEELCGIVQLQSKIIRAQADALAQLDATVMEDQMAEVAAKMSTLLGHDEAPEFLKF